MNTVSNLRLQVKSLGVGNSSKLPKHELVYLIESFSHGYISVANVVVESTIILDGLISKSIRFVLEYNYGSYINATILMEPYQWTLLDNAVNKRIALPQTIGAITVTDKFVYFNTQDIIIAVRADNIKNKLK